MIGLSYKIKVAIIDVDPDTATNLKDTVNDIKHPHWGNAFVAHIFNSAKALLAALDEGYCPNLLFIVDEGRFDGLELAAKTKLKIQDCEILVVSARVKPLLDSFLKEQRCASSVWNTQIASDAIRTWMTNPTMSLPWITKLSYDFKLYNKPIRYREIMSGLIQAAHVSRVRGANQWLLKWISNPTKPLLGLHALRNYIDSLTKVSSTEVPPPLPETLNGIGIMLGCSGMLITPAPLNQMPDPTQFVCLWKDSATDPLPQFLDAFTSTAGLMNKTKQQCIVTSSYAALKLNQHFLLLLPQTEFRNADILGTKTFHDLLLGFTTA